jgi:hypothetical protein
MCSTSKTSIYKPFPTSDRPPRRHIPLRPNTRNCHMHLHTSAPDPGQEHSSPNPTEIPSKHFQLRARLIDSTAQVINSCQQTRKQTSFVWWITKLLYLPRFRWNPSKSSWFFKRVHTQGIKSMLIKNARNRTAEAHNSNNRLIHENMKQRKKSEKYIRGT